MGRWPILAASSRVFHCGVWLEEPTPVVDSQISTVVPPRNTMGRYYLPCISRSPGEPTRRRRPGPTLTTMLTELCTHCHEPSAGDKGFFFLVPFLSFGWGNWVSCLVLVFPNPAAPRSISSRVATFLIWGASILSRMNWAIRSPAWTIKFWQSDWIIPLWSRPDNLNLLLPSQHR